jgi:hypothetical protein
MDSYKHFYLPETLKVDWEVAPAEDGECPVRYRLQIYDTVESAFVDWSDLRDDLIEESEFGYLRSELMFNENSGEIEVNLSATDVAEMEDNGRF